MDIMGECCIIAASITGSSPHWQILTIFHLWI